MNHFQKQGKIHINQKKQQNPHKIAKITKKTGFLASLILGVALSSVFFLISQNLSFIMCGVFERETWLLKMYKNNILIWYCHLKLPSSPIKFKNQDLHNLLKTHWPELIYAQWKINSNCDYLSPVH